MALSRGTQDKTIEVGEIVGAVGGFMKVGVLGVLTYRAGERGPIPTPFSEATL